MKVLHVITTLRKTAGPSIFCVELCQALGMTSSTIAICDSTASDLYLPQSCEIPNYHVVSIQSVLKGNELFDLVHIHGIWEWDLHRVRKWASRHCVPYCITTHGGIFPWAMAHKRWKKIIPWFFYQKRDLQEAKFIHATAKQEKKWIRNLGFQNQVVVAPLGVTLSNVPLIKSHYDVRTLLFVGRIYPVKGLMNLLQAFTLLSPKERLGWQVKIVGPDQASHRIELEQLIVKLGIGDHVVFTGALFGTDKDQVYKDANIFVLPSFMENFGAVVVDALSFTLPVITTKGTPWQELNGRNTAFEPGDSCYESNADALSEELRKQPCCNEIVANGRCGWWIDVGIEPLVQALKEAIALSDEERHMMGMNGRRLVEEKYTWESVAEKMYIAYEQVILSENNNL